jgi:S1-C subfamily serine protease
VDRLMPDQARNVFGSFRRLLGDSGFPQVFGGLSAERIAPVKAPGSLRETPAVDRAAQSIVRVDGEADSCSRSIEGSGFVYAAHRVVTNAHVVAGVQHPVVRVGGRGRAYRATIVGYDPERDVAVLDVPALDAPALAFDRTGKREDDAVVAGFPRGGPYRLDAARIRERIEARGPDIYSVRQVARQVFSLYTTIQPGNSGGPLLSPQGKVYGVVFAKSLDDPVTGYALTVQEVAPVLGAGRSATAPVDTGACAA